ncbi:hypothetical protein TNCV_3594821 [Trichonephila clavipes]|nr:hypothetical protein TNCV_3594821 [Trichonephila clavipes]
MDYNMDMSLDQQSNIGIGNTITLLYLIHRNCSLTVRGYHLNEDIHKKAANHLQRKGKNCLSTKIVDHEHSEVDSLYQLACNEFQDIQSTLQQAVSAFNSPVYQPKFLTSNLA